MKVWAGDGIQQVRAVTELEQGVVLAEDFHIDLRSHRQIEQHRATFPYSSPVADGVLQLLETGGDLTGEVHAANIACCNNCPAGGPIGGVPGPGASCSRLGVFVRGVAYAPITVDYFVWFGNIVAATYVSDVSIGRFIKGCVVAAGGSTPPAPIVDGRITSIEIGRGDAPPGAIAAYDFYGPGLCGIDGAGAFAPANDPSWFAVTSVGQDGGALDGAILAAHSMGSVDLSSFSLDFGRGCKSRGPRIEAPTISSIRIDDFAAGSVWSGDLSRTDDYANIGMLSVGCMNEHASIWMESWLSARFDNTMFGDLHVPNVPVSRSVQIGKHFGEADLPIYQSGGRFELARCECVVWDDPACLTHNGCPPTLPDFNPNSPQFANYPSSVCAPPRPDRGRIWIREGDGLHGQVVINASALQVPDTGGNPFGDVHLLWSGAVELGGSLTTPPCVDESIADDSTSSDLVAAYYTRPSTPLGGGAVGVVPYRMYETDSVPAAGTETNPAIISQARLCGVWTVPLTPIGVRFYGPLVPANEVGVIEMRVGNTWQVPLTNFFWHRAAPAGGNARELRVSTRAVGFPSQNIFGTDRQVPDSPGHGHERAPREVCRHVCLAGTRARSGLLRVLLLRRGRLSHQRGVRWRARLIGLHSDGLRRGLHQSDHGL